MEEFFGTSSNARNSMVQMKDSYWKTFCVTENTVLKGTPADGLSMNPHS